MKILLFILFIIINIILANIDANKIKQNKSIFHGINGLIYSVLIGSTCWITHNWVPIIGLALLRIPIFNTALNYFRGLPLTYLSSSTTSIIDRITNWIPEKIGYWTYNSIILIISLILVLL